MVGAKMNLTDGEKLILMMLAEIHEKVGIKNGIDPTFVKEAIWSGNAWGLKWKFPGVFDTSETPESVRDEVLDVLDMWSLIEWSYKDLSKADKARVEKEAEPFGKNVRFRGFDGNNESKHLNVARFLIDHLDRYSDFKNRDLNSHMPSIDAYRRMFKVFESMRNSLGGRGSLDASQIIEILKAMIHPSRRAA
jgi:uncharacterized protein YfbU (UPF0304 family)